MCGVLVCVRSRDPPRRDPRGLGRRWPAARRRGTVSVCAFLTNCRRGAKNLRRGGAARAGGAPLRLRGCAEAALRSRRVRASPVGSKRHKVLFESQGLYHARASCAKRLKRASARGRGEEALVKVATLAVRRAVLLRLVLRIENCLVKTAFAPAV